MTPNAEPLFAIEGTDVITFGDRQGAERYLEAVDVEDNVYRFFTGEGVELRLATSGKQVVVTGQELGRDPEYLATRLRYFLKAVKASRRSMSDATVDMADLPVLINEMLLVSRLR